MRDDPWVPARQQPLNFDPKDLTELLGQGRRRCCYPHPQQSDIVIKVNRNRSGIEANLREWWFWHQLEPHQQPLFNPCWYIWQRGRFLAQPRLQSLNEQAAQIIDRLTAEMPEPLKSLTVKQHIWGWDPQRQTVRIFDYEHIAPRALDPDWIPTQLSLPRA